LHNQTFYGAVKRRDEEKLQYVVREPLRYKASKKDNGFKSWEELNERIVDLGHPTDSKELKPMVKMMLSQFPEGTSFKEAYEKGIYMLDKNGHKVNQIRHVRCYDKNVSNPVKVKKHTYQSKKEYKQYVWAALGDGSAYALCEYSDGHIKEYKKYTYMEISENRKSGLEDIPTVLSDKKGQPLNLVRKIIKGDMLLLYQNSPDEVLNLVPSEFSRRLYRVISFEGKCRINLLHHLLPKFDKKGESVKDFNKLPQAIRCSINGLSFLQKDVDFVFSRGGITLKEY
jgi:CRISPR-associated endonuclease Csn1